MPAVLPSASGRGEKKRAGAWPVPESRRQNAEAFCNKPSKSAPRPHRPHRSEHDTYSAGDPRDAPGARTEPLDRRRATDRRESAVSWRFGVSAGAEDSLEEKVRGKRPTRFSDLRTRRAKGAGLGRSKDPRTISRDIARTKDSPRSRCRRSPAAHHSQIPPPQPESPRTMKSREHKLDICFDFTRGTCHRGDGCRFSHNLPPGGVIPPRPKTAGVCFDYTKGICNRGYVSRGSRRPRRDLRGISRRHRSVSTQRDGRRISKSATNAF